MKPRSTAILRLLTFAPGLIALAGCNILPPARPDATRFYVLAGPRGEETAPPRTAGARRLGLKPVEVASYLRKGTLVVRTGGNEIVFADEARWADRIEQEIARTLRLRLLAVPGAERVFAAPFPIDEKRDFDVSVQVLQCEGVRAPGGAVARFSALVEITAVGANGRVVARRNFTAPESAWDGKDFARLAALLGESVGALAQEVVAMLPEKNPGP